MDENKTVESRQKFTVYFSLHNIDIGLLDWDSILIYPSEDKFNNFGFRTLCHYVTKLSSGLDLSGFIHLAFIGEQPKPYKQISSVILEKNVSYIKYDELPQFYSVLPTMQEYRNVISKQGTKLGCELLLHINDLVAFSHSGKFPEFYDQALNSDAFKLSFLRNSETFFAFHNAVTILNGLTLETLGEVSHNINLKFKLDGFANAHQLRFNFDPKSVIPKRICVVIGKNGVGKSQTLGNLVRLALSGDKSLSDSSGGRPSISRLVAIGTPGEGRVTFPSERRGTSKIFYRRLLLSRSNGKDGWRGIGELLVQLARSEDSIKGQSRWQIFCDSLSNILPLKEIAIPLRDGSDLSRWGEVYKHGTSNLIKFEDLKRRGEQASLETWGAIHPKSDPLRLVNGKGYTLSSGQLAFLRFAAQICLYIENGTLILLDEPETHLHPNLISTFVDLLDQLLKITGSIAIIATHSVYFVREVPRSQVSILQMSDNGVVDILLPRLKTFGADVGAISTFVFNDNIDNKLIDGLVQNLKEKSIDIESTLKELGQELSIEALIHIRQELQRGKHDETFKPSDI